MTILSTEDKHPQDIVWFSDASLHEDIPPLFGGTEMIAGRASHA